MSEKKKNKSYNIMRHEGIDDMDYVSELELDPRVAFTPEINDAIIQSVATENYAFYIAEGKSPEEARELTDKMIAYAKANVAEALPNLERKGY